MATNNHTLRKIYTVCSVDEMEGLYLPPPSFIQIQLYFDNNYRYEKKNQVIIWNFRENTCVSLNQRTTDVLLGCVEVLLFA